MKEVPYVGGSARLRADPSEKLCDRGNHAHGKRILPQALRAVSRAAPRLPPPRAASSTWSVTAVSFGLLSLCFPSTPSQALRFSSLARTPTPAPEPRFLSGFFRECRSLPSLERWKYSLWNYIFGDNNNRDAVKWRSYFVFWVELLCEVAMRVYIDRNWVCPGSTNLPSHLLLNRFRALLMHLLCWLCKCKRKCLFIGKKKW